MVKSKKLLSEFYELKVSQLMDRRVWDLPIPLTLRFRLTRLLLAISLFYYDGI